MAKKSEAKASEKQGINGGKVGYGNPPISEETQFKPGICPNPKGRPPGPSMRTVLQGILDQSIYSKDPLSGSDELKEMTGQEKIALNLVFLANHFDIKAIKEVFDRIDGKASQPIDLSGGLNLNGNGITKKELDGELAKLEKEIAEHKKSG